MTWAEFKEHLQGEGVTDTDELEVQSLTVWGGEPAASIRVTREDPSDGVDGILAVLTRRI